MFKIVFSYGFILFYLTVTPIIAFGEPLLDEAIRDFQFQNYTLSESKFNKILASDSNNITAHYYLGIIYQTQGKYPLAIQHLEIVAKSSTPVEGIKKSLATAYLSDGMPEKALQYFRQEYKKKPKDEQATFDYAKTIENIGDTDQAAKMYRQLIKRNGKLVNQARYQLGSMLSNMGAYVSAIELMRAIDPKSPYGDAAKSYEEALDSTTKPINLYLSTEYFFDDNPATQTSTITSGATSASTTKRGSQGVTLISGLNSRAFEATDHVRLKLGYLYYATFYKDNFAKDNDFVGHFVNPSMAYQFNKNINIELKGDAQFFYFGHQKLSFNFGTTLTTTYNSDSHSLDFHAAYLHKSYTDSFTSGSTSTTLAYLDANTLSIGAGSTLTVPEWGGSLTADYTLNNEYTVHNHDSNFTLARKSRDSKFREHVIQIDTALPLPAPISRIAILGHMNYSYKNYLNSQSGEAYSDITNNQKIKAVLLTLGASIQAHIWEKYDLDLTLGYERNNSHAHTTFLTYQANRYYGQLSGSF